MRGCGPFIEGLKLLDRKSLAKLFHELTRPRFSTCLEKSSTN